MRKIGVQLTQEDWNKRRSEIHGDKYQCLDGYGGKRKKLRFVCVKHGTFEQTPEFHLRGNGCTQCYAENRLLTQEEFDRKRYKVHGDRYYCLDNYQGKNVKLRFVCDKHGVFSQTPDAHTNQGQGCRKCAYDKRALNRKMPEEEWQRRRKEVHGEKYECLDPYVNDYTKLRFICPDHGEFKMAPMSHMRQGQGCPSCSESKGEKRVDEVLKDAGLVRGVDYLREHRFDDCRKKRALPFDFYIPSLNLLIEYDGELHFKAPDNGVFGGEDALRERQENDQIKNDYCTKNNIKLVRIPYTHYDQIETILEFVLEDLNVAA